VVGTCLWGGKKGGVGEEDQVSIQQDSGMTDKRGRVNQFHISNKKGGE